MLAMKAFFAIFLFLTISWVNFMEKISKKYYTYQLNLMILKKKIFQAKPRWTSLKTPIDLSQYESRTTLKQTPNVSWIEKIKANIAYRQFLKNFQYVKGNKKQDCK